MPRDFSGNNYEIPPFATVGYNASGTAIPVGGVGVVTAFGNTSARGFVVSFQQSSELAAERIIIAAEEISAGGYGEVYQIGQRGCYVYVDSGETISVGDRVGTVSGSWYLRKTPLGNCIIDQVGSGSIPGNYDVIATINYPCPITTIYKALSDGPATGEGTITGRPTDYGDDGTIPPTETHYVNSDRITRILTGDWYTVARDNAGRWTAIRVYV